MDELSRSLKIIETNLVKLAAQSKSGQAVLLVDAMIALTEIRHLTSSSSRAAGACGCPIASELVCDYFEKGICKESPPA